LFVRVVTDTTKSEALIDEEDQSAKIVNSIRIHEIVSFFLDTESIFLVCDFELFERVAIVVNVHSLNETLFLDIQLRFVFIIFRDVRKLFRS
jgi:hypothetical protein